MKKGLTNICYGFFSTLANPTRLAILEKLDDGEMNVSALASVLGQEQSMISHNLKILERHNFVFSEKRGKEKYVSRNEVTVEALLDVLQHHSTVFCKATGNCDFS
ncbi:MAG: metalloregulator ArsR/SmtB family transcription factor [Candidatus Bathyarchaeota archaeon]|nr:metalloregulator ArsR/SmtB family transcription factor [Candidatus Bathyarchaeota archaeon]